MNILFDWTYRCEYCDYEETRQTHESQCIICPDCESTYLTRTAVWMTSKDMAASYKAQYEQTPLPKRNNE